MKHSKFPLTIFMCLIFCFSTKANDEKKPEKKHHSSLKTTSGKPVLNFFIISKRKKGKLDLATRFNVFRTSLRGLFHHRQFIAITTRDSRRMSKHVQYWLDKRKANLGTIWFDSHGMYKKGYSLFFIGHDELNYKSLTDPLISSAFSPLSRYTNEQTKIVIGSCYGGATYKRASIDYKDTTLMKGDSLMARLGKLFGHGQVFACESWVMSKPGLFQGRPAAGGNPGRKLFLDVCYEPAWKNIGIWNEYTVWSDSIKQVNPIALDKYGNMVRCGRPYIIEKKIKTDIEKKLIRLQPNLYK